MSEKVIVPKGIYLEPLPHLTSMKIAVCDTRCTTAYSGFIRVPKELPRLSLIEGLFPERTLEGKELQYLG